MPVSSHDVSMPTTTMVPVYRDVPWLGSDGPIWLESKAFCPSAAAIRGRFMPTIRVKENEPFEVALRRFKRTIEKSGLLTELRAREFYEKPTAERKRKKSAAIKRHFKRLRSQMLPKKLY